jgi:hypothetical protein
MSDERKPLLVFPTPTQQERRRRYGGASEITRPSHDRQVQRVGPKMRHLQQMMSSGGSRLQSSVGASAPEQVLVFELAGQVDEFLRALERVEGLDWLLEELRRDIEPDEDFYVPDANDKDLTGMLYFVGTNQRGMDELVRLWARYEEDQSARFEYGLQRFKHVFDQLKDLRRWDYRDRLRETGVLENWEFRLQYTPRASIRFEAELWYRSQPETRRQAYDRFKEVVEAEEGRVLSQFQMDSIRYHGVLAELPVSAIQRIVSSMEAGEEPDVRALLCADVMAFRPAGQVVSRSVDEEPLSEKEAMQVRVRANPPPAADVEPVAALLDGFPLQGHDLLTGRLSIDDPDGWEANYPPRRRHHGTTMASLIIHGDLQGSEESIRSPLYVRPIFKPDPDDESAESIPEDLLTLDLIHRAVKRMFEGDGEAEPAAPNVKVINLSVASRFRTYDAYPSAWARLLDWLSVKYGVLFNVSAGNYPDSIEIEDPDGNFEDMSPSDVQAQTLKSLYSETRLRRLRTPAEAINALTVGASHADECSNIPFTRHKNLIDSDELPSPINALGLGFNRAVKPDLLFPGGRALYSLSPIRTNGVVELKCAADSTKTRPPGQKAAAPSLQGITHGAFYTCGTSNATAMATRHAVRLLDVIDELREQDRGSHITDNLAAVLLKALLAHGASWSDTYETLHDAVDGGRGAKENIARLVGYGSVDRRKALYCTDERATIVGCGTIQDGEAHGYAFPLPPSLSAKAEKRKLTITLAWFTPINCKHSKYRRAHLWFVPPEDELKIGREEAHGKAVQRGTLQHEIVAGSRAVPIVQGSETEIAVNCRADAGKLEELVPYALVASLEVAEGVGIPVYDEVKAAIQTRVRTR